MQSTADASTSSRPARGLRIEPPLITQVFSAATHGPWWAPGLGRSRPGRRTADLLTPQAVRQPAKMNLPKVVAHVGHYQRPMQLIVYKGSRTVSTTSTAVDLSIPSLEVQVSLRNTEPHHSNVFGVRGVLGTVTPRHDRLRVSATEAR